MNAEEYKHLIFRSKNDVYQVLATLKAEGDFDKIKKIIKVLSAHPLVKSTFKSNDVLKGYLDLRKQKPIPFSENLIGEATFFILSIDKNKDLISLFIELKENFDKEILLSNYEQAEEILQRVEKVTGKSLWLIENTILLKELKEGVKSNWNEVSELSKVIIDPLVLFFVENFSKKAESRISYFRYVNILTNQVNEVKNSALYEYISFKLNYLPAAEYTNLAYFLFIESGYSVVDKYLVLREVFSELLSPRFSKESDLLLFLAGKIHDIVPGDIQIVQILSILSPTFVPKLQLNDKVGRYFNEYSKGNYQYCLENGVEVIKSHPTTIECYEIFSKSLIEAGKPISVENLPPTIGSVVTVLYNIYSNQDNFTQSVDQGLKICVSFSSTSWAKQFLSLLRSTTSPSNGDKLFTKDFLINSKIKNPRILYYAKKDRVDEYLEVIQKDENLYDGVMTLYNIIRGNSERLLEDKRLTQNKRDLYFGRSLMRASKFEDARTHLEILANKQNGSAIFNEEVIVNLFRAYIKLNQSKEACCLFVKNYLSNEQITRRLDKVKLLNSLEAGDIEKIRNLIELPIFYKIASDDSYQQYVAYDTFIEAQGYARPTEMLNDDTIYDANLIYFLREVCTIEIMHHSYHFNGTDDIENERLQILSKLIVADSQLEDSYIKEITEFNQNSNIRKAIREVNKGRISVNVQQLRNNETNNIKEAFSRYKEIESYSKIKNLVGIDLSLNILSELSDKHIEELDKRIVHTKDPAFISFKVIFIEIRDKFLLSKEYGLDGYLSTRIRHGTLLNHIRSTFESENIISQRDKDNNYLENEFWNTSIPFHLADKRTKIQNAIKKFSRAIDEYTEFIVKELIQVKTEKHTKKSKALFDYSMGNQEIATLFGTARENIKDHNVFLNFVFDYLQGFTEALLKRIRNYINDDINKNYNKILQDFNDEIKEALDGHNYPELINSISLCGTRIQSELRSISEWFYLSNTSKGIELDLKVLIQTAIQITNTISPNNKLNPTITEDHNIPMIGTIHFIYICRILLDNIIVHSKLSASELKIEIHSQIKGDLLEISFKNNLSKTIDTAILDSKLSQVKSKWEVSSNDYENIDIEGGSGFDKIRRIIVFDLNCERYKFDYKIEGEFLTIKISIESDIPYEEES